MVNGNQSSVSWHVDDLKVSHKDSTAIDEFLDWEYLGMKLDNVAAEDQKLPSRARI